MTFRLLLAFLALLLAAGCSSTKRYSSQEIHEVKERLQGLEQEVQKHDQEITQLQTGLGSLKQDTDQIRRQTALRIMDLEMQLEREDFVPGPGPETLDPETAEELPDPPPPPEKNETEPDEPASEARQLYNRALDLYFDEQAEQARETFREFIDTYPQSPLAPNAWYWMAETFYMEKEYPQSILTFRQVLERFPEDPKAPDALLKIGYAYNRLEDIRNARFYLGVLLEDYPDSSAADKARQTLDSLGE